MRLHRDRASDSSSSSDSDSDEDALSEDKDTEEEVEEEATRLFEAGHRANACGQYEDAYEYFRRANELRPRPEARLSAANMALKVGDANGAMEGFLGLLKEGEDALPANYTRERVLSKIGEASKIMRTERL